MFPGLWGPRLSSLRGAFFPTKSFKELVISEEGPDGPNYTNLSLGGWKEELAIWFEPIVILWKV